MSTAEGAKVRVVVVTQNDAATVIDCLDGVAAQGQSRLDVVVVDLGSGDGSADLAIRHPLPSRVVVTRSGDLDRVLAVGSDHAVGRHVVVLGARWRPTEGWLDAALAGLADAGLVLGSGGHGEVWQRHFGVDRERLAHLSIGVQDATALRSRVGAAGAYVAVPPGMAVVPARSGVTPPVGLPELPAPGRRAGPDELVSVVLCTKDRPEQLLRCLRSLAHLEDDAHEILVIDNHPRPTVDGDALPPSARLVHEPRRGLDVARNRGWQEAAGAVVAYVDDDCEVDPHWLAGIRAGFADPEVRAVTGRVRPARLARPSEWWFEAHFSFDRGTRAQRFTPWDQRPWYPMWSGGVGAGCNMAFRRSELVALDGFDEALDMGTRIPGGGDLDAFTRVLDRESLIAYRPDALVWHHHRTTERRVTRQFLGYGIAVGALVTKSLLDRPGRRVVAVRFYLDRLRLGVRLLRAARAGTHPLPVRLVGVDLVGQLIGPLIYLAVRPRCPRRAQP